MTDEFQPTWSARTRVAQALGTIDAATRALVPPISVSTTYIRDADNAYRSGNAYGRHGIVQSPSQGAGLSCESGFADGVRSTSSHQD